MFRFIAADLRRHWAGVLAITLIIALATALGVIVTLQERALRLGSARAADAFDLVIGAPGSETQLVLSSVFLQAAPLPLLPGTVLASLVADPRVTWAAPVGFGDFVEGSPIVGTTQALIDGLAGLSEGTTFAKLGEAVIGADVEMQLGDSFHPQHGQAHDAGGVHTEITYRIVGRLSPTGTPWDRAVLVPIETVWQVHEHGAEPEHDAPVAARSMVPAHEAEHHGPDLDAPVNPDAVSVPGAPGVPAIIVKPRTIGDAYKLRQAYRNDHSLAVFPGEVLTRLYGTLGDARFILSAVAMGAQALVGAAILLVVTVHIMQRRRQIGALRAFGAPRATIFAIVWTEAFAIIGAGLLAGFGIGYAAARALSGIFTQASGVVLPVSFAAHDCVLLAGLLIVSGVVASVPALLAYRQSPASALRA